jgi:hypothetical protein
MSQVARYCVCKIASRSVSQSQLLMRYTFSLSDMQAVIQHTGGQPFHLSRQIQL